MFPVPFAFDVVQRFSKPGEFVLDPFVGRGSSIFAAAATGRHSWGIEINPVGWLYSHVKLQPATRRCVLERLEEVARAAGKVRDEQLRWLPPFFFSCYTNDVLKFLMTARKLNWQTSRIDATLMAIILVYLHGKREQSLSNQMRQGKAMSPEYSLRWWNQQNLKPPTIDPAAFLKQRILWRFAKGIPKLEHGHVFWGDSTRLISRAGNGAEFSLLFTSPPYHGITNYHYDQWLRLWMLGGPPNPKAAGDRWQRKFASKTDYQNLLTTVFSKSAPLMRKGGTVYVRTDARSYTFDTTQECLLTAFKPKRIEIIPQPVKRTQTALFKNSTKHPGEIDIVLTL
jgi:DNA modification methylase